MKTFGSGQSSVMKIKKNILDNEPMKTFGSGQSSIMNERKTKACAAGLRPYSTSINYGRSIEIPKLENFLNHKTKITVKFPSHLQINVYSIK